MAQRVLNASESANSSIQPLEAQILVTAVNMVSKGTDVITSIEDLFSSLQGTEMGNAKIYHSQAKLFSRLCGRNQAVLKYTVRMMKSAIDSDPRNAEYHCELAYQHRLQGQYGLALDTYRDAAKLDESR